MCVPVAVVEARVVRRPAGHDQGVARVAAAGDHDVIGRRPPRSARRAYSGVPPSRLLSPPSAPTTVSITVWPMRPSVTAPAGR